MSERRQQLILGLFVCGSLVVLAVLIVLFGGAPDWFTPGDEYLLVFDSAQNVAKGTPVRRSGVKIGQVRNVELERDADGQVTGKVLVRAKIDRSYKPRKSDEPTIVQGLLSGDTTIDFLPLRADVVDNTLYERGASIPGKSSDPGALLSRASDVLPNAQISLDQIRKSFERLEKMAPQAEETLREYRELARSTREVVPEARRAIDGARTLVPELAKTNDEARLAIRYWGRVGERLNVILEGDGGKLADKFGKMLDQLTTTLESVNKVFDERNRTNLAATLENSRKLTENLNGVFTDENRKNLAATLDNLRKSSESLDASIKEVTKTMQSMDVFLKEATKTIERVNKAVSESDSVLGNLRRATAPLAERSEVIVRNVEESSVQLNKTLTELRALLQSFARGEGTVSKLLTDPSIFNNLNDASIMITRIIPRVDRALRDLETFADKIARHPELLGAGGAVRPSAGLKDPPFAPSSRPPH
jgi:phospholipid/cholesterol/gamma-HCH transport system substrate-binding protein